MELRAGRGWGEWERERRVGVPKETSHDRGLRREERAEEVWIDLEGKTRQGCWGWEDMGVSSGLAGWTGWGSPGFIQNTLHDEEESER